MASISTTVVCKSRRLTYDLPSTFLMEALVNPMRHSRTPIPQGTLGDEFPCHSLPTQGF